MKRIRQDCPVCGEEDSWLNLETGWLHCYRGHNRKMRPPASNMTGSETVLLPPPISEPLSEDALKYLRGRLQLKGKDTLRLPAKVRETGNGLLFHFPMSLYWQIRIWSELQNSYGGRRWLCPSGGVSEPYLCLQTTYGTVFDQVPTRLSETNACEPNVQKTESQVLTICEGILDSLAIYNLGYDSLAVLTTIPRIDQLKKVRELDYQKVLWIPDGDVGLPMRRKGMGLLELMFGDVTLISLPPEEDPASLKKIELKKRLEKAT